MSFWTGREDHDGDSGDHDEVIWPIGGGSVLDADGGSVLGAD